MFFFKQRACCRSAAALVFCSAGGFVRCFGMVGVHESREKPGFGLDLGDGSRGSQLWLVGTWIFIDVDTIYK
jgi:hypothetical protein